MAVHASTGEIAWESVLGLNEQLPEGKQLVEKWFGKFPTSTKPTVVKVVTDAPPAGIGYNTTLLLENQAKLSYSGGNPAVYPSRLTTKGDH